MTPLNDTSRIRYVEGIGRNPGEERQHSHLYALLENGDYVPMCIYGWNRSNGEGFSIFRGHSGARGLCRICERRREGALPPIESRPDSHKTKWV